MEHPLKIEINKRIEQLQLKLKSQDLDAALINQIVDVFYYTGSFSMGNLIVPTEGEPCFLVERSFSRVQEETIISNVHPQKSFKDLPFKLKGIVPNLKKLGLVLDVLPTNFYHRFKETLPGVEFTDISTAIRELRMYKSNYETEIMKKSAEISRIVLEEIPRLITVMKKEVELSAEIEYLLRTLGHQGEVRMREFSSKTLSVNIVSGENLEYSTSSLNLRGGAGLSAAFPQGAGWKRIQKNETVLVDFVTVYNGYCVNCARVYSLGAPPKSIKKAHRAAMLIHEEIIKTAKPGMPCYKLFNQAKNMAQELGYGDSFMCYGNEKDAFIGHGMGLEFDELPLINANQSYPLTKGMFFTIGPLIILPGNGITGMKNTYFFDGEKLKNMTLYTEDLITL